MHFTTSSTIGALAVLLSNFATSSAHPQGYRPRSISNSQPHLNCFADVMLATPQQQQRLGRREGEIKFGYGAADGPMTWPTTCQTGKFQSPIDLTDPASLLKEAGSNIVKPTYTTTNFDATFKNIGTTIQVDIPAAPAALTEGAAAAAPAAGEKGAAPAPAAGAEGAASAGKQGYSTPNGTFFELKQFHFHTPSEHRKFGQMLPMEMHMVHTSAAGEIAVVAVMFEFADAATVAADTSRAFLTPILAGLSAIKTTGTTTQLKNFNFAALAPMIAKSKEWVYSGSLTTPPCSEGVIFNILDDTMKITSDEFLAFNSIIKFNSRLIVGNENVGQPGAPSGKKLEGGEPAKAEGAKTEVKTGAAAEGKAETKTETTTAEGAKTEVKTEATAEGAKAAVEVVKVETPTAEGAKTEVKTEGAPAAEGAKTEAKPAAEGAKTEHTPPAEGAKPEAKPAAEGAKTEHTPPAEGAKPEAKPAAEGAKTEVTPTAEGAKTEAKPAAEGEKKVEGSPAVEVAKVEGAPAEGAKTEATPAAEGAKTEATPAAEGAKTEAKPAAEGEKKVEGSPAAEGEKKVEGTKTEATPAAEGAKVEGATPSAEGAKTEATAAAESKPPGEAAPITAEGPISGASTTVTTSVGVWAALLSTLLVTHFTF